MSGPSPPNTKDTSRPPTRPDRSPAEDTKVNHADHHRRSRRGRRPGTGSTGRAATGVKPEPGTFNASGPSHPAMDPPSPHATTLSRTLVRSKSFVRQSTRLNYSH